MNGEGGASTPPIPTHQRKDLIPLCRVLIGTSNAIRLYHRLHGFNTLLSHLERECGGHGNGVSLHRDGAVIKAHKGVDLKTSEIAEVLLRCSKIYDVAIFHTRIASVNVVSDSNCHPFIHGNDALAMNGTLSEFREVAQALDITDTEVAFNLVHELPFEKTIAVLSVLRAVFVGVAGGKPYALRNGGALKEWCPKTLPTRSGDFLFASSFPKGTRGVIDLPEGFVFADGERTEVPQSVSPLSVYGWDHFTGSASRFNAVDDFDAGYEEGYNAGFEDGLKEAGNTAYPFLEDA